ncbi:MAG: ATP-binding cassette domain-containing protein [Candidatus Dormibacteria bacterium]
MGSGQARNQPGIQAEGLVKAFGRTRALDQLSLEVEQGTLVALLGPNGAGKTTAVRIFTTLLRPDAGRARVAGFDVVRQPERVRAELGLAGQAASVDEYLTGRENLEMVGRLYHLSRRDARERAGELLEQFELAQAGERIAKTYSGGMRRRLDLAAALVVLPPVLFLDEPTTGLDPRSRRGAWEMVTALVAQGCTVLLTTQYLEEADELANRIVVVDQGRVIAEGTAEQLKRQVGGDRIELEVSHAEDFERAQELVAANLGRELSLDLPRRRVSGPAPEGTRQLARLVRQLDDAEIEIGDLQLRQPSLDDVFLTLTGHQAELEVQAPRRRWLAGARR